MKIRNYFKTLCLSALVLFACIATYFSSVSEVNAATASYFKAYKKANYEQTSKHFELKVNNQNVDVVTYYEDRYDYAHLAFEGTTTFEIKSKHGDIQYCNVSPHSYNIKYTVNGNTLKFDLTQKESRYLVIKITAGGIQQELFIACDPDLGLKKPDTSKDNVVDIVKDYKINTNFDKADGKENSKKINQAIKDMAKKGGGTVYFPGNTVYKFVTIDSGDNVTLYLDDGAVLRGSGKRTDYDWNDSGSNGRQSKRRDIKITSDGFSIVGTGMIDANAMTLCLPQSADKDITGSDKGVPELTREEYNKKYNKNYYPGGWDDFRKGIVDSTSSASGITFKGVTFKEATGWSLHLSNSRNIKMNNIKLLLDYSVVHADGYDIASCTGVEVKDCLGITGDDTFCPKASNSKGEMKNYLFETCVAYARGGAGCKIGMQGYSRTDNIVFKDIDVIQGYRGFCISHDDGEGEFSNIKFIDIRTEKIWINNTGNKGGQFRPAPFVIWALNDGNKSGNVHDVEVTNCSFEDCASLPSVIKGDLSKGVISNVTFTDLVMNGRTITSDNYDDIINPKNQKLIDIGNNVKKDTIKFKNTKTQSASKVEYEGEFGEYSDGAKTVGAGECSMTRKAGSIGKSGDKERTVRFTVYVKEAGKHTIDIFACVNGTRSFQLYVNGAKQKKVECKGKSVDYPVKVTTTLELKAGNNEIKFGNPNAAAPDLDKFIVYEEGGTVGGTIEMGSPVEAEWGTLSGEAKISDAADCSGDKVVSFLGGASKGTASFDMYSKFSGKHKMHIYYASGEERLLRVVVNGKQYDVTCPSTGSYTKANTSPMELEVEMTAGNNQIQFTGKGEAYAPNLDQFVVLEKEIKTTKFEAENGIISNGATVVDAADCSGGKFVGDLGSETGAKVTLKVKCDATEKRVVKLYYCQDDTRNVKFVVNGKEYTHATANTGGWGVPTKDPLVFEIDVVNGENTIEITGVNNAYAPNIDCFELELTDAEAAKEKEKPNGPGSESMPSIEPGDEQQQPENNEEQPGTTPGVENVAVTNITLSNNDLILLEGETVTLAATIEPSTATNKGVTWSNSNPEVVSVVNGAVTALKAGTATITATTVDGNKTAQCNVLVEANPNNDQKPDDGNQQQPEDNDQQPGDNDQQKPDDTNQKPGDTDQQPGDNDQQKPDDTNQKPGDNDQQPGDNDQQKPDDTNQKPGDNDQQKPDDTNQQPGDNDQQQPNNNGQQQGNNEQKPAGTVSNVKSITINGISKKIAAGKTITLTADVETTDGKDAAVIWSSSEPKYASVDADGRVAVKRAGKNKKVTITAEAADGSGIKATYTISIMPKAVKKITIKAPVTTIEAGKKLRLQAIVTPSVSSKKINKTLNWSCNSKYASVTQKGVVKAKKAGVGKVIKITAKATDGSNKKIVIKLRIE